MSDKTSSTVAPDGLHLPTKQEMDWFTPSALIGLAVALATFAGFVLRINWKLANVLRDITDLIKDQASSNTRADEHAKRIHELELETKGVREWRDHTSRMVEKMSDKIDAVHSLLMKK